MFRFCKSSSSWINNCGMNCTRHEYIICCLLQHNVSELRLSYCVRHHCVTCPQCGWKEQSFVWVLLYRISDKGWSSSCDVGQRAAAAHRKYHPVPKYCRMVWTEFVSPRLGVRTGCCDHVKGLSGSITHGNFCCSTVHFDNIKVFLTNKCTIY
jgi:hypothetical protein